MYSDLASPFEELCMNTDSAGGKLVLLRSSDDSIALLWRYGGACDVSHGKFWHCRAQIRLPGGGGGGGGGGGEQFVGYAATAVTLGNDVTDIGPEILFL